MKSIWYVLLCVLILTACKQEPKPAIKYPSTLVITIYNSTEIGRWCATGQIRVGILGGVPKETYGFVDRASGARIIVPIAMTTLSISPDSSCSI